MSASEIPGDQTSPPSPGRCSSERCFSAIALHPRRTPLAIGIALFVELLQSPPRLASTFGYLVDLLAAVPSVVFGLWGANFLGPRLVPLYDWLEAHFGWIPFFAGPASATGRTMLTVGVVLAIMIVCRS